MTFQPEYSFNVCGTVTVEQTFNTLPNGRRNYRQKSPKSWDIKKLQIMRNNRLQTLTEPTNTASIESQHVIIGEASFCRVYCSTALPVLDEEIVALRAGALIRSWVIDLILIDSIFLPYLEYSHKSAHIRHCLSRTRSRRRSWSCGSRRVRSVILNF